MTVVRSCFFCWKVSFLPCVPEVLCGLTIVFARRLGLHADSDWTCQRYTFMLVMMFCNGILSKIGWTTSWRCPVWFLLARRWDRLKTQKASLPDELLIACQRIFAAADVEVDDGHLAVCVAVSEFLDRIRRLPKRQVGDSDEKRAEDALAERWDRLMAEKASVSEELLSSYNAIFGAAEMEVDDGHIAVCIAVSKNLETAIQVVMSVCMAGVELCDIPTCLMEVAKCLLCQGFKF